MINKRKRKAISETISETKLSNGIVIRIEKQGATLQRVKVLCTEPLEDYSEIGDQTEAEILARHLTEKYSVWPAPFSLM